MAHSPYPSAADDLDEDIFGDEDEDIFGDEDEDILGDEDEDILGLDDDDDDLLGDDDDDLLGDDDDDDDLLGDDDDDDDLLGDDDYDLLGDDDDDLLGDDATDALERDVDTYGLGHDDDDMWDDMMHQADSGPQGYSATALSYMSPVEVEDDLLSPYALQQLDPMGEFGGDEDDDEDEFAAEMEIEELEEFGIVGVIATTAFALVLGPVALTAAVAAPMGLAGALGALAGPKKKYMRVAARLARLAEKDKTKTAKWARNVGRLRSTWRRLKKKGKTGGMQSPNTILKALRGGSRSPVFQQAARVQQSGAAGTPTASISSHDKAQLQRRRQQRRRQQNRMRRQKQQAYQQQQSRQSQQPRRSRQGYPQSSQRSGIRPHQMREMQRAQQQTNFARRSGRTGPQATIGKPPTGYTPTSISQGEQRDIWEKGLRASRAQGGGGQQGGGQQRGLSRRNQYGSFNNGDTQVGIPAGYTLTPNFGTVLKEHPFKSILALGGIFAAGVMLSTPTKNMVSGLTDRYRG